MLHPVGIGLRVPRNDIMNIRFLLVINNGFLLKFLPTSDNVFHVGQLIYFGIPSVRGRPIGLFRAFLRQPSFLASKGNLYTNFVRVNIGTLCNKGLFLPRRIGNFRGLIRVTGNSFWLPLKDPTNAFLTPFVRVPKGRFKSNQLLYLFRHFRRHHLFLFRTKRPTLWTTCRLPSELRRKVNNFSIPIRITSINLCTFFLRLTSH